jgi:hypothetical protein
LYFPYLSKRHPIMAHQEATPTTVSASMVEKKNSSQFVGFQTEGQEYAFRI